MEMREKLTELLDKVQQNGVIYMPSQMDDRNVITKQISNEKIADALIINDVIVVEHGYWEAAGFDCRGDYKECCSNCKSWSIGDDKLYCPVCGAKMDLER